MIWALRGVTEPDDHRPSYPTTADLWLRSSPPLQGTSPVTDPISTFSALPPVKREPWAVSHHGSLYLVELMNDSSSRCAVLHFMQPAVVNSSDADPNILSVKGAVVNIVKTMTTARPTLRDATSETLKLLYEPSSNRAWVSEALSLVADRDIYVTGEPMFDVFWRILIAHSDSRAVPPVFGVYYNLWL
jgi:hypothetical protein